MKKNTGIFRHEERVCKARFMGIQCLHAVDKSQNRNNSMPWTVDNLVDGVDRYASIHLFDTGMNMQMHTAIMKTEGGIAREVPDGISLRLRA